MPPYDRLPQVVGRYSRTDLPAGLDAYVEADYTRFESDRILNGQPNARRAFTLAQVSRPWQAPGWFVTPKLQLHSTQYDFDAPLVTGRRSASRTVPTFSLDSGMVFERDASYLGRSFRQTLEPRAFYVYTPYRDQSRLPNYDSAANDFNFATIYTENAFGGHDRIADNNLLTLGATTRLLDPDTGAEAASFGVAQRLRFKDQRVTLPGVAPVSERAVGHPVRRLGQLGAAVEHRRHGAVQPQDRPLDPHHDRRALQPRQLPRDQRRLPPAARPERAAGHRLAVAAQRPVGRQGRSKSRGRGRVAAGTASAG